MHFRKSPTAVAAAALLGLLPLAAHGQSASYAGTPYSGTAPSVPAVIPTVNFDRGGEGVAYRDLSAGNLGGQYRTGDSVDIYRSTDSIIGSYEVANFQTGEWMSYTVNVPASGTYVLSIRASNRKQAAGAFHLEVDGVNVTGTISVPKTGSWSTYQWFGKKAVALTAGKHVVKIVSEKQWFNVTALSIQASTQIGYAGTPYSGTLIAAPTTFPAINFDKGGEGVAYHDLSPGNLGGLYRTGESVDIYPSQDSVVGPYKVENFQTGEWMNYTVNVPASGNYDLGIRAANNLASGASGAFRIEVDGVNATGTIAVPITGSWDTYQWFGKKGVPLTAGNHVIKLVSEQQWFDVSALTVLGGGTTNDPTSPTDGTGGGSTSGTPFQALWTAGFEGGTLGEFEGESNSGSADSVAVKAAAEGIPARSGSWVMKQSLLGTSGGTRMYRHSTINSIYRTGQPIYYSFWAYFPQSTRIDPNSSGYFNLVQVQSHNGSGLDPVWILGLNPSNFTLRLEWWGGLKMAGPHAGESGRKVYDQSIPIPVGQWVQIQLMVVPREDYTGAVRVWLNDKLLYDITNVRTKYPENFVPAGTQSFYISKNAYGEAVIPTPNHHYVDDVAISLQPRPYAP